MGFTDSVIFVNSDSATVNVSVRTEKNDDVANIVQAHCYMADVVTSLVIGGDYEDSLNGEIIVVVVFRMMADSLSDLVGVRFAVCITGC